MYVEVAKIYGKNAFFTSQIVKEKEIVLVLLSNLKLLITYGHSV